MTNIDHLKLFLSTLGFTPEEGKLNIWSKIYVAHNNYRFSIDFNSESIDYGDLVTLGDKTTCNFKSSENFVVLECVNRLLEKGYSPERLVLEKDYPLGHKTKGKLDVLVNDLDGKAYLMIECKTWGSEYEKASKKTLLDGGQILSYFQQDTSAKFLCLYTSRFQKDQIEYINGIIKVEPEFLEADNVAEVFEQWNKNLKDNGIFESDSTPYNIIIKALTKESLKPLTKDDSSRIFNQFAEILRHHVVSDKPNAFNKLITLLLCKIVDEDRADNEELDFQWLENDSNVDLQKRLNDLYKIGMDKYLTKIVTDYSDKDVEDIVGLDELQKTTIKKMMTELRLKKNNEFAFKEVFNDDSFEENSKVLKEIVELFQPYQVRYNKKQQFLGDFFELLLNTSIKQEAGQFFTPVPIARFIINSLPIKELIIKKINSGDSDFLPYVIDYAVGSGHFLTEVMDEIHTIIHQLNENNTFKPSIKKSLSKWADDYDWAYDFIYGIEKDYRLVKTAKVSCFLNGDGLARIFNADGLANFETSKDYQDKLKIFNKTNTKENQQFEILIANPPYSVSAFKNTLEKGEKSFDLYNRLTDESSEIECLFIERTKQLLKDEGYAGIILPSSILSNSGIYEDAREILLKYFKIVAITEFGSNTFMATGTNTVTLFLQRRSNADWQKVEHAVNQFFINAVDVTINGIENAFTKYVSHVYKSVSLDDFLSLVHQSPNDQIKAHELFIDYKKAYYNSTPVKNLIKRPMFKKLTPAEQEVELNKLFIEDTLAREKEKLLYFLLAHPQKTLLIKSNPDGKNETEKEFLGYEFSNRRGHEGIKPFGAQSISDATKLYEYSALNPEKVNTYIHKAFLDEEINVHEKLGNHINQQSLVDMMLFDRVEFSKSISLAVKKKVEIESKWPLVRLGDLNILLKRGKSPLFGNSNVEVIKSGQARGYQEFDFTKRHFLKDSITPDERNLQKGDILINSTGVGTAGRVTLFELDGDYVVDSHITILRPDTTKISSKYILYNLSRIGFKTIEAMAQGQSGQIELSLDIIKNIKIPLPPKNIQEQVIKGIKEVEEIEKFQRDSINDFNEIIRLIYDECKLNYSLEKLSNVINIIGGGTPDTNNFSYWNGSIPWLSIVDFNNAKRFVNTTSKFITEEGLKNSSAKYLDAGDIIISARGTVGALAQLTAPMTFNQSCYGIKGKSEVDNGFLYYALKFEIQQFKDNSAGVIFDAIVTKTFESIYIPLPPIEEQKKIVAKIEEIEKSITEIQSQLLEVPMQKAAILNKYLN